MFFSRILSSCLLAFVCYTSSALGIGRGDSLHVVKIHFLYGSKPGRNYRAEEDKYFGGIHGGHVSIQMDTMDVGFIPVGRVHIFAHRRKFASRFTVRSASGTDPYPFSMKVTTIEIPMRDSVYHQLLELVNGYVKQTPYDYAFFGMRCAAASQDILGKLGVVPRKGRLGNVLTTFYPRKLRRRILKVAERNHYHVIRREGRISRRWERE